MSVRELSRRIFQSLWRGFYRDQTKRPDDSAVHVRRGYKTLEVQAEGRGNIPDAAAVKAGGRAAEGEFCYGTVPGHGQGLGRFPKTDRRRSVTIIEETCNKEAPGQRYYAFETARKALIGNVLRRVTNTQAANLRRRAAKYLTGDGNPSSFLALVGVSLASGTGIMTKEDEIEGVCHEIRQAVSKTSLVRTNLNNNQEPQDSGGSKDKVWSLEDFELGSAIAKGCSAVVYSARAKNSKTEEFNLAMKMMFNYHAESNALTILRAMQREIVAAREVSLPSELQQAALQLGSGRMVRVPHHPNIVEIYTAFADRIPGLPGAINMYGDALPTRLNPEGSGRNMSLFLVMRRYDCSLRDYLSVYAEQLTTRISSVLFTQLLEGVAFLHQTGVAHRDLKSDNILIDISGGVDYPRLVITDFGCCLADSNHKLKLPYTTYDTDKGGNPALMAPEVASAKPGAFKTIDYSKSDLWTAGTIAYEIFGGLNPFYSNQTSPGLLSTNYTMDDLPSMPEGTPVLLSRLVRTILSPAPSSRPEPKQAATICQLYLWSPSQWIKTTGRVSSQDVLQWLLTMTTKVLCESRWGNSESALQEYQLVATFLTTTTLTDIKSSISWIQDQLDEMED